MINDGVSNYSQTKSNSSSLDGGFNSIKWNENLKNLNYINDLNDLNDYNDNNDNNNEYINDGNNDNELGDNTEATKIRTKLDKYTINHYNHQHNHIPKEVYDNAQETTTITRPKLGSRSSSFSSESDSDISLPVTPLTPKFSTTIQLPVDNLYNHHREEDFEHQETPLPNKHHHPNQTQPVHTVHLHEPPKKVIPVSRTIIQNTPKRVIFQETPKKQIIRSSGLNSTLQPIQLQQLRTPPNSKLKNQVRQPLIEPQAIILRPTTFWRHHPLSPHSLPISSPSSRVIRRSTLIASPTIGIQHPNPDQETTRICVGLAGLDLDIDPKKRKIALLPI